MTMRVAITGASGNVGTALLRRLSREPDIDVVALARRVPPLEEPYKSATWHSVDISEAGCEPVLEQIFAGVDAVVHLVWGFQPTRNTAYLERVGPLGGERVLSAAHRAGVRHLVHMSSVGAYAPKISDAPVNESYPHTGMPTSLYSTHKARAERCLDDYEREHPRGMTVARVRPGIVLQRDAGASLSRYGLPAYLPARLLTALPLLPLDRRFTVPVVHSDDLAECLVRMLTQRGAGAFNVAADEPVTRADVAAALGARSAHVPAALLHGLVDVSWRLRLQPLSPGWLDLGFAVPLQDCARARLELGWTPRFAAREALQQALAGIRANSSTASPALRARSATDRLRTLITDGPISYRRRP